MKLKIPAGARPLAAFGDWTLYKLPARENDSFLWSKFKIMLPINAPLKHGAYRVFRLAWHHLNLRFGRDVALMRLQSLYPELYAQAELYLTLNFDRSALIESDAEITAELARLAEARRRQRRS